MCGRLAGWRVLADPDWPAWLKAAAARFHCRPGWGHIMAAVHLQLVFYGSPVICWMNALLIIVECC